MRSDLGDGAQGLDHPAPRRRTRLYTGRPKTGFHVRPMLENEIMVLLGRPRGRDFGNRGGLIGADDDLAKVTDIARSVGVRSAWTPDKA